MKYMSSNTGKWVFKVEDSFSVICCNYDRIVPDIGYLYSRESTKEEIKRLHRAFLNTYDEVRIITNYGNYIVKDPKIDSKENVYNGDYNLVICNLDEIITVETTFKDGDFVETWDGKKAIFKRSEKYNFCYYAVRDILNTSAKMPRRHLSEKEKKEYQESLYDKGIIWQHNIQLKRGDYIYIKGCNEFISQFKEIVYGDIISYKDYGLSRKNILTEGNLMSVENIREIRLATEEEIKLLKSMTHPELKPGMVIEYQNGERRLVVLINDKLRAISNDTYLMEPTEYFTLKKIVNIVKIYQPASAGSLDYLLNNPGQLIWKYEEEVKELTMQEIANKFGIPVEKLRIKE